MLVDIHFIIKVRNKALSFQNKYIKKPTELIGSAFLDQYQYRSQFHRGEKKKHTKNLKDTF